MALVRERGRIVAVECDNCPETFAEGADLREMTRQMRAEGWKITEENGVYTHVCADCAPQIGG